MKNFGFGCMRLPMIGGAEGEVDIKQVKRMTDKFIAEGFTYFDTAHGYIRGKSETAIKECLTSRYPREAYTVTDKLTDDYFDAEEDIRPFFESQLAAVGVEYFDYYLMHALTAKRCEKFVRCNAFGIAKELKAEGKIRHIGISFHDTAEALDAILSAHPEIEVVQIQFNYADYSDPAVQSGAVYDVCRKYGKPVIVMEPCKGGNLVNIPDEAKAVYDELGGSYASYAIRYAASFEGIFMVLSGMSNLEQMEDNLSFMKDFRPLDERELEAVGRVCGILHAQNAIPCTACRYCVEGCPKHIVIPDVFACLNSKRRYKDWSGGFYYSIITEGKGKASDCIECGQCERACPQHLPIRELLKEAAKELEK